MSDGVRTGIGRLLASYSVAAGLVAVALYVTLGQATALIDDWVLQNVIGSVSIGLLVWLLIARQPRNGAVWALTWAAVFQATNAVALGVGLWQLDRLGYSFDAGHLVPAELPTAVALIRQVDSWVWIPGVFLLLTLALLLFPDGRPPNPRWRWVGWWSGGAMLWTSLVFLWIARPSSTLPVIGNEPDLTSVPGAVVVAMAVGFAALFLGMVLCLSALVVRFRRSSGLERQQFRWIAWGSSFFAMSILLLVPAVGSPEYFGFAPMKIAASAALGVFTGSYVVAVARYRLYEIDRIISRTASYALVTAALALTYIVSVLSFRALLSPFTEGSELAVAASTLAVAAAFVPVRTRVQILVDRRFNRAAYDAQRAVEAYSQRLRDEVELDAVLGGLVDVASDAVQPSHAGVWLVPSDGEG